MKHDLFLILMIRLLLSQSVVLNHVKEVISEVSENNKKHDDYVVFVIRCSSSLSL